MKIHHKHAELYLLDKIKHIRQQRNSWRAIYMHFSHAQAEYSDGLRTHMVVNIIREMLQGEEGNVYLLGNSDVCILFQGSARRITEKLGSHFSMLLTFDDEENGFDQDRLFSIIDLGVDWEMFYTFCGAKVAAMLSTTKPIELPKPEPQQAIKEELVLHYEPDDKLFVKAKQLRRTRGRLLTMVVEDEAFTRRLVSSVLRQHCDIIEAPDGATALDEYANQAPDVVFLDIDLPDSNGHVLLQKIRALDPNAFVIMLSAHSYKENILAALEEGAQGFVTKPFAKEKLLHYLRQREASKQNLQFGIGGLQ